MTTPTHFKPIIKQTLKIGVKYMEKVLKQHEVNYFLSEIESTFPNFVAGIVCDRHGFPIASRMPKNFHIQENQMALTAIAGNREFIDDPRLMKVKRDLNSKKNVKLLILLDKQNQYINRFKALNAIIERQNLF